MANNYRSKGMKPVMVWVESDLHAALRKKLAGPPVRSLRSVFIRFLEVYTGHKVEKNAATGQPDIPPTA